MNDRVEQPSKKSVQQPVPAGGSRIAKENCVLRRGMTYLVLLTAVIGGTALAQKTPQDKAENNRKQAEALRKEAVDDYHQSEEFLGKMKKLLKDAKEAEKRAADDREQAKKLKDEPQLATALNNQAAAVDLEVKAFNHRAGDAREKADSLLAEARAAWQKSQAFEETPCPGNKPYCAPEPTHPVKK
jgi:hypothetical protein